MCPGRYSLERAESSLSLLDRVVPNSVWAELLRPASRTRMGCRRCFTRMGRISSLRPDHCHLVWAGVSQTRLGRDTKHPGGPSFSLPGSPTSHLPGWADTPHTPAGPPRHFTSAPRSAARIPDGPRSASLRHKAHSGSSATAGRIIPPRQLVGPSRYVTSASLPRPGRYPRQSARPSHVPARIRTPPIDRSRPDRSRPSRSSH